MSWISCDKRLPGRDFYGTTVAVTVEKKKDYGEVAVYMSKAIWTDRGFAIDDGEFRSEEVIAWIAKPYEQRRANEYNKDNRNSEYDSLCRQTD